MPATQITTPPKAQVKPYDAAGWNAQDANTHQEAINDHAEQLDQLLDEDGLVRPAALPAHTQADANALLALMRTQLDGRYALALPPPTPPASYNKTLTASDNQANGVVAAFASSQQLKLNALQAVSGGGLTLTLLDGSDSGRANSLDYLSSYAGNYYLFVKKDGSTYEAQWPAADTSISV